MTDIPGEETKGSTSVARVVLWLPVYLPLVVSILFLVITQRAARRDGADFVAGLHAFAWILYDIYGGIAFLLSVSIAIAAHLFLSRRKWVKLTVPLVVFCCSAVLMLVGAVAMGGSFMAARDRAYSRLDCAALHEACRELHKTLPTQATLREIRPDDMAYKSLPPVIRRLHPLFVYWDRNVIVLQIDGGGPMYHEGIGVAIIDKTPSNPKGIKRLHPSLPVYLYRLYDYRMFADSFR